MSEKKSGGEPTSPAVLGLNIVIPITLVEAAATVAVGSTLGMPIMREGFVTDTGFLPSSPRSTSLVSVNLT